MHKKKPPLFSTIIAQSTSLCHQDLTTSFSSIIIQTMPAVGMEAKVPFAVWVENNYCGETKVATCYKTVTIETGSGAETVTVRSVPTCWCLHFVYLTS